MCITAYMSVFSCSIADDKAGQHVCICTEFTHMHAHTNAHALIIVGLHFVIACSFIAALLECLHDDLACHFVLALPRRSWWPRAWESWWPRAWGSWWPRGLCAHSAHLSQMMYSFVSGRTCTDLLCSFHFKGEKLLLIRLVSSRDYITIKSSWCVQRQAAVQLVISSVGTSYTANKHLV